MDEGQIARYMLYRATVDILVANAKCAPVAWISLPAEVQVRVDEEVAAIVREARARDGDARQAPVSSSQIYDSVVDVRVARDGRRDVYLNHRWVGGVSIVPDPTTYSIALLRERGEGGRGAELVREIEREAAQLVVSGDLTHGQRDRLMRWVVEARDPAVAFHRSFWTRGDVVFRLTWTDPSGRRMFAVGDRVDDAIDAARSPSGTGAHPVEPLER